MTMVLTDNGNAGEIQVRTTRGSTVIIKKENKKGPWSKAIDLAAGDRVLQARVGCPCTVLKLRMLWMIACQTVSEGCIVTFCLDGTAGSGAQNVELSTGCNNITCRCKAEFCYECTMPWKIC